MQLSAITASLGRFIAELQRRKVLRVATGYMVGAWIVLQVAVALQTAWALSAAFSGTILNLMIILFPAAVGLAWFFEITPQGIKRTAASGDGAIAKLQTTDFVLAGALALVFCIGVAQLFWPSTTTTPAETATSGDSKTADADKPKVEPPRLGDKSIAVLPFANLSPDKGDAYFADGMTEEIINVLVRMRGIRVISRTSSFAFKGKEIALPQIAKQLSARHILEGSIRRNGDDVRITAQLIDVATDAHLWSRTFDRKVENIFAVQDEIARAIVAALDIELTMSAGPRNAPTKNMEAYRLFLLARESALQVTDSNLLKSVDLYKQAIALDPNFAEAQAHLANAYGSLSSVDPAHWNEHALAARASAEVALKLDPKLAEGYVVLSYLAQTELKWVAALENASKAITLEPSNIDAIGNLSDAQFAIGAFEQATRTYADAESVDPIYNFAGIRRLAIAFASGDDHAAAQLAPKVIESATGHSFLGHLFLALTAQAAGDREETEKQFRLFVGPPGENPSITAPVARAIRSPAARDEAVKALKKEAARDPAFQPDAFFLIVNDENEFLDAVNGRLARGDTVSVSSRYLLFVWRLVATGHGANPKLRAFMRNAGLVDYWKANGWPDRCHAKGENDFECS